MDLLELIKWDIKCNRWKDEQKYDRILTKEVPSVLMNKLYVPTVRWNVKIMIGSDDDWKISKHFGSFDSTILRTVLVFWHLCTGSVENLKLDLAIDIWCMVQTYVRDEKLMELNRRWKVGLGRERLSTMKMWREIFYEGFKIYLQTI